MNTPEEEDYISLYELLVKTSYQTQITHPTDVECAYPFAFGSGFIVEYNSDSFFVTADHTLHLEDYYGENEERTGTDYRISIFNNVSPESDFLSTVVTPLSGFYYMEKLNLDKPDNAPELVDITVCKIQPINVEYPFLTTEVQFPGETIKAREEKLKFRKESFNKPCAEKMYFVFGVVKSKIDEIRLNQVITFKNSLKFVNKSSDYYLFNTPEIISDREDWEGLSGSAVVSEDGECVGVLCSVNENSHSVWVMPIEKVEVLINIVIKQEEIEKATLQSKNTAANKS